MYLFFEYYTYTHIHRERPFFSHPLHVHGCAMSSLLEATSLKKIVFPFTNSY